MRPPKPPACTEGAGEPDAPPGSASATSLQCTASLMQLGLPRHHFLCFTIFTASQSPQLKPSQHVADEQLTCSALVHGSTAHCTAPA